MKKLHELMMSTTYNVYELLATVLAAGIIDYLFRGKS